MSLIQRFLETLAKQGFHSDEILYIANHPYILASARSPEVIQRLHLVVVLNEILLNTDKRDDRELRFFTNVTDDVDRWHDIVRQKVLPYFKQYNIIRQAMERKHEEPSYA